ncbi:MAG: hypothetical protein V4539_06830 [Bacteroidota bacterium]
MPKTQFTFRVTDLLKLIGTQTTGNILITETKTDAGVSFKAQLAPTAPIGDSLAASLNSPSDGDGSIDGCPYPPGCN